MSKLQNISIVDKNGTVIFDQSTNSKDSVVNHEALQVLEYTNLNVKIQLRDLEIKKADISVDVDNIYQCPKALWNKMRGIKRAKYNEGMATLLAS